MSQRVVSVAACIALTAWPLAASAEPGETSGASGSGAAEVIDPVLIRKIDDLRFGSFAQPTAAAQMTVSQNGSVSATGDIASTMNIVQSATGRGPARFEVETDGSRLFRFAVPSQINITNGSSTMAIRNIDTNTFLGFVLTFQDEFTLRLGGTLYANANQEPGQYSGDFQVTVFYY